MRLKQPRVQPIPEAEWDADTREVLGPMQGMGPLLNRTNQMPEIMGLEKVPARVRVKPWCAAWA